MIISILIICIVLNVILTIVFIPLFKGSRHLSYNIREKTYPKFIEINKTIITLTSGIIAVTVSFLNNSSNRVYLISSWILFGISLVASVIILFLQYGMDCLMAIVSDLEKKKVTDDKKSNYSKDFIYTLRSYLNYGKVLIISFYIQLVSFATGIVMLIVYGII